MSIPFGLGLCDSISPLGLPAKLAALAEFAALNLTSVFYEVIDGKVYEFSPGAEPREGVHESAGEFEPEELIATWTKFGCDVTYDERDQIGPGVFVPEYRGPVQMVTLSFCQRPVTVCGALPGQGYADVLEEPFRSSFRKALQKAEYYRVLASFSRFDE